ncbi:MAG: hypothetical protein HYX55_07740 [Chloroflexi bacterium]|nr:hypothetical protein [Chloroflexota bacterium]
MLALTISGLVAACSPAGVGTSPAGSAAPPSATSTPAGPRQITSGNLPPGTYATTLFQPPLTFTLADGWFSLFPDDPDEVAFERNGYTEGFYIGRVGQVVDPVTNPVVSAPTDLVAWLSKHPAFRPVGAPTNVTVAGIAGRAVELDVIGAPETEVFAYPTGNTRVHPGSRFRYIVLPIAGPALVLTCFGTSRNAFDEASPLVDASLASLAIRG